MQARAAGAASIPPQQIGRDATLIQKDVLAHIAQWLRVLPLAPRRGHIRTTLVVGVYRFFNRQFQPIEIGVGQSKVETRAPEVPDRSHCAPPIGPI